MVAGLRVASLTVTDETTQLQSNLAHHRRLERLPLVRETLDHLDGALNVIVRLYQETEEDAPVAQPQADDAPGFISVLPDEIEWKPFPAFPPSARLAVLVGEPTQAGPYLIRVKVPSGVKLMPHKHPEDRIYTVMSGVFYIGLGETFDGDRVQAYPPGSVIVLPGETWHFHWAKSGEYVTQVTAVGPLGLEYRDSHDDPRRQSA